MVPMSGNPFTKPFKQVKAQQQAGPPSQLFLGSHFTGPWVVMTAALLWSPDQV